ncbi:zinc finger protein 2-like [Schistocerca serialis cubense]|uniref:zinc finger protein 2-like n=1 Tax=Schistocerca serialis cubense TaxID=2023355 RepID=UPI00214F2BC6|nr:zinc finger protein 2-like [Schistocerca serialis cubense]
MDWSHISLEKHPPCEQLPQLQKQQQERPKEPGSASQGQGDPNAACVSSYMTPADVHIPNAPGLMAVSPLDSFQRHAVSVIELHDTGNICITNPTIPQAEKFHGLFVKPDDHGDPIHHPPQSRVAWETQLYFFPLQQQQQQQQERTYLSPPASRPSHEGQAPPEAGRVQPPPWSPESVPQGRQLEDVRQMERPPVQASSPPRVLTELLPSKTSPQPTINVSFAMSFRVDGQQDSRCAELKNEHNVNSTYTRSYEPPLHLQQVVLPNDQQRLLPKENALSHGKEHICKTCSKKFATRYSLKLHSRTHTGEKPHMCAQCGKRFSQRRNYRYHLSLHSGSREFEASCPVCAKVFSDRGYLSSHMKIHRDQREYACTECGRRFNQRVAYNTHVRTHTGERAHRCTVCGETFYRKALLRQHMENHTKEKPLACLVCAHCGCSFAQRHQLRSHVACHAGAVAVDGGRLSEEPPPSRSSSVIISTPPPAILNPAVSSAASRLPPPPPRLPPQPAPSLSLPSQNVAVGVSEFDAT